MLWYLKTTYEMNQNMWSDLYSTDAKAKLNPILRVITSSRASICVQPNHFKWLRTVTDSNYATHVDNRKSVSGLGGSISWNSKKQPTVNLSSCRAEYIARSVNCAQEIRCVQQVTTEVLAPRSPLTTFLQVLAIFEFSEKSEKPSFESSCALLCPFVGLQ